jgi:ATP-binding cassette, subfamily B, bacterial CvaB/MchF/RaxB
MSLLNDLNLGWRTRLPMVLQAEAAECGIACIAMVAGYLGYHADISELRRRFGLSLRGATLKDLIRVADQIGFVTRPVRLDLEELCQLKTPCILHWDLNHFVVLKSVNHKIIVLHDPAVGVRKLVYSEASKHFTGVALEFSPASNFEPAQPAPRLRLLALVGRMVGLKRSLGHIFLLALAIEACAVTAPFFMQWVVDHALMTADRDLLLTLALGFFLLLMVKVSVSAMRGWMLIALGASLKVQGRANLFSHLINLPSSFFEGRYMGDVMSRFGSQETILQAITTDMVEVMLDGLLAVVTLIVMFLYAPTLAMVVLAGALLYGLLRWASYRPLRQASTEAIVWAARRDSHFLETLRGIKTIKLFNGQGSRRAHWLNLLVQTINRQLTTQKLNLLFRHAQMALTGVLAILVVWLGAQQVLENTFSVGMLLAFIAYKDQFLTRVGDLINKGLDLHMLRLHSERLADIALTEPEPRDKGADRIGDPQRVAIEVRNLCFRYGENEPWVLDGISFRINPGETVAIVGVSGCGKTTLLKILASLLQPTKGEILVNDRLLVNVGMERYRSMLGVVMQDDQLFAGSISDNISFFSDYPDPLRTEECARLAAVHDDIATMPMDYNTLIGDMGTVLSGGQKQRVLIARALYHRPGILLMDEATSHLDVEREKAVNAAIRSTYVTRIIVAHRPETIHSTDRIIVLDKGRIVKDLNLVDTSRAGVADEIAGELSITATGLR